MGLRQQQNSFCHIHPAGAAVLEQQVTVLCVPAGLGRGQQQPWGCSELLPMACSRDQLWLDPQPCLLGAQTGPAAPSACMGQSTSAFLGAESGPAAARPGKALRGD